MDIQVNKDQLERVVIKWLNMYFGDLTPKTGNDLYNSIYYVNLNDEVIMEYDQDYENIYIHYDHIWSKLESLFHINYDEIQSIMKVWLEETYKLEGVKPIKSAVDLGLEED